MRLRHILSVILFTLLLPLSINACRAAAPPALTNLGAWPMEGYSPNRSRNVVAALHLPLNLDHEYTLTAEVEHASPATIAGGLLFVEGDHKLHALRQTDGKEQWQFNLEGSFLSPAVVDGVVYVRSERGEDGYVYAITAERGAKLWQYKFAKVGSSFDNIGGHVTSPVVVDGLVLVGAAQALVALDAQSGAEVWSFATEYPIVSSVALAEGVAYFADFSHLYAVDLKTGGERWNFAYEKLAVYFAPVLLKNQVALASADTIYMLDRSTGKPLWNKQFANTQVMPAGSSDQHLYVKSANQLWALNHQDGTVVWNYTATNYVSLPAITSDQLFVITRSNGGSQLRALQLSDGKSLWQVERSDLANAAPVIAGDGVYVRTGQGNVLVFRSS